MWGGFGGCAGACVFWVVLWWVGVVGMFFPVGLCRLGVLCFSLVLLSWLWVGLAGLCLGVAGGCVHCYD